MLFDIVCNELHYAKFSNNDNQISKMKPYLLELCFQFVDLARGHQHGLIIQ
jgi:hypothetical protein